MRQIVFLTGAERYGDLALLVLRVFVGAFLVWGVWDNIVSAERMDEFVAFLEQFGFVAPELMARAFSLGSVLHRPGVHRRIPDKVGRDFVYDQLRRGSCDGGSLRRLARGVSVGLSHCHRAVPRYVWRRSFLVRCVGCQAHEVTVRSYERASTRQAIGWLRSRSGSSALRAHEA